MTIFDRSWYRETLGLRTKKAHASRRFLQSCEDIVTFERQLTDDGAVIIKFWLHISNSEQERRLQKLRAQRVTAWQVTREDRWQCKHYQQVRAAVEDLLTRTDTPTAPWIGVPATDRRYARIAVFETILDQVGSRLGLQPNPQHFTNGEGEFDLQGSAVRRQRELVRSNGVYQRPTISEPAASSVSAPVVQAATPHILANIDRNQRLDEKVYQDRLVWLQAQIHMLGIQVYRKQRPVVLVFEGWDAAGKGGAIQRITAELDPRAYVVHPIAAPSGDDKARHYLYRFWRRLPPGGQIGIFDRSWYGRVLVERVEGFAKPHEWQRAYAEINEFERQLVEFGTIICKFWLHIGPDEQLRRFEERQQIPYKAWKLTDEDWRNREKWGAYEAATDEMLLRTSTPAAPWTIVEAEDKRFARIKVLTTVVRRLEADLGKVKL
jgi:polyphosphate kinase 2 (PPK2 family)